MGLFVSWAAKPAMDSGERTSRPEERVLVGGWIVVVVGNRRCRRHCNDCSRSPTATSAACNGQFVAPWSLIEEPSLSRMHT